MRLCFIAEMMDGIGLAEQVTFPISTTKQIYLSVSPIGNHFQNPHAVAIKNGTKIRPVYADQIQAIARSIAIYTMTKFLILCAIYYQAIVHGFDPRMVAAQVFVESSFRPAARCAQCVGLLQVNVPIWKDELKLDPERMTEVNYNLDKGLDILCIYIRQTGDIWKALHFYNNGPSGKYNNTNYVRKVKRIYNLIKGRASCHTW